MAEVAQIVRCAPGERCRRRCHGLGVLRSRQERRHGRVSQDAARNRIRKIAGRGERARSAGARKPRRQGVAYGVRKARSALAPA